MRIDRRPMFPFHDILSLFAEKTNETPFTQAQRHELMQQNFSIVKMDDIAAKDLVTILTEQNRVSAIRIPEEISAKVEKKHPSYRWVALNKTLLSQERNDAYHPYTKTIADWVQEFRTKTSEYTNGIVGVHAIVPDYAMGLSLLKQSMYSHVHQQFIVENGWRKPEWSLTTQEGITIYPQVFDALYEQSEERHFWFRWNIIHGQADVKHRSVVPVIVPGQ